MGAPRDPLPDEDRRLRLETLRDGLEARLPAATDRDYAALAARYQAVLAEIAALPAVKDSDGIDDLAAKRQRRRAAATGS